MKEFSAFLSAQMAKGKGRNKVRLVEEDDAFSEPLVRLTKDRVEEVVHRPEGRGTNRGVSEGRLEVVEKARRQTRSKEPELDELVEHFTPEQEDEWDKKKHQRTPWGWIIVLALLIGAGIVWSIFSVKRAALQRTKIMEAAAEIIEDEEETTVYAETVVENLKDVVRAYYSAATVEELLKYVRHPERVEVLIRETYEASPLVARDVVEFQAFDTVEIQKHSNFWLVASELSDGEVETVIVEILEDQSAKVDWETATRYQPMEWKEFVEQGSKDFESDFRIFMETPTLPTEAFEGRDDHMAVLLFDYEETKEVYGYVEVGTETHDNISSMLQSNGGTAYPAILRLGKSEKTGQIVILKLVQPQWLYVTDPSQ